jgi:hypothetical protein
VIDRSCLFFLCFTQSRGRFRKRAPDVNDHPHVIQLSRRAREEERGQQSESQPDVAEFVQEVEQFPPRQQREIGRYVDIPPNLSDMNELYRATLLANVRSKHAQLIEFPARR